VRHDKSTTSTGQVQSLSFERVRAEDRRRVVLEQSPRSWVIFFPLVAYVGVMEWITRPGHRTAVVIVAALYVLIAASCLALLRRRPQWAEQIAVGGVSALCAAMLAYSPMVRGSGELCVLAITILIGGFAVGFPLGLRNQLLASIVPIAGYFAVLQLGTTTAYPVWYSASALLTFLAVVAVGARSADQYRLRILKDAFAQTRLAAENERLRDEARAADRAKTDLMSMLSHELRGSLGTMQLMTELMLDGAAPQHEWKDMLARINGQSRRALDLVHTMLEFGSADTGRLNVTVEEIDVGALLAEIRDDLPEAWLLPGVALQWNVRPGVTIRSDRGKLEAIVRNLVHNALRHTTSGYVSVVVNEDPARHAIRLIVADSGEGIAGDALPRIFDRFSRATSSGAGFGLGLYIVKRFAEVLGGRVEVLSTPDVGTRFEVILPRRVAAADEEFPLRAAV
jgi:signal transduction histidine kinase